MAKIKARMTIELQNELRRFTSDICSQLAQETSEELYKTAQEVMADFYNDYTPQKYKRTYGHLLKTQKRYYNNSRSKYYHGGVMLVPSPARYYRNFNKPIPESGADFTKMNLLDMVYNGWHGMIENFNQTPIPLMKPSPMDILNKKRLSLVNDYVSGSKVQTIMRNMANSYTTFRID